MLDIIYNENCLDTLSRLKNDSVNVVITSPPYNMNLRIKYGKYLSRQITQEISTKYQGFSDNLPIEEFYQFHLSVLRELLRVSPLVFYNIQIVTGSKRAFFKIIGEMSDYLKDIIIWDKGAPQPAMGVGVINRQSELILVFERGNAISRQFKPCYFERGTLSDVWYIKRGKKKALLKSHSAVFPELLVETILENFTQEQDIVFDPFMGTGTTAVVCQRMNRRFIGSEIVKEYVDLAYQRLANKVEK